MVKKYSVVWEFARSLYETRSSENVTVEELEFQDLRKVEALQFDTR